MHSTAAISTRVRLTSDHHVRNVPYAFQQLCTSAGIRRAGAALKWGHGRAASILQDIHSKATQAGDTEIIAAARKQLARMS